MTDLEKAQNLYKAKQLYAQKNQASDPGIEGMGSPDGPTAAAEEKSLGQYGLEGLSAVGKTLDVPRGVTTGPALALALKALTGKSVASVGDVGNAVNPTNLKTFPSSAEMFEKAGVPQGAQLSDYVGGYGEPGSPWYQPEKGGMLDPTIRGTGGFATDIAIDPLTYLSFGASAAGKKAIQSSASRMALEQAAKEAPKSGIKKALSMAAEKGGGILSQIPGAEAARSAGSSVEDTLAAIANKFKESKAGRAVIAAATAPSEALKGTGKRMYDSVMLPVEHEGAKYGKKELGETFYNAGVKTPFGLRDKAQAATDVLLEARDKLFDKSAEAGGRYNMDAALEEAKKVAAEIREAAVPGEQGLADMLEKQVKAHEAMVLPPEQSLAGDMAGLIEKQVQPKKELVPSMGSRIKSSLYNQTPDAAYNEFLKTPAGSRGIKILSEGAKNETERAVGRGLGPQAAADVAELNAEAGKFIGTKKSQRAVSNKADRIAHNATSLTGTDSIMGSLVAAAEHDPKSGILALLAKKGTDVARLGWMPAGYGIRKAGESTLTGPLTDSYIRQKLKEMTLGGASGEEN